MKKMFLFLFFVLTLTACKKDNDVNPAPTTALADKFAGSYKLNSFRYSDAGTNLDLPTLPVSVDGQSISGTVTLRKLAEAKLTLELVMKATGADDYKLQLENLDVKQVGSEYGLFSNNRRIADVDGTMLIFNLSDTDPTTKEMIAIAFVAKR